MKWSELTKKQQLDRKRVYKRNFRQYAAHNLWVRPKSGSLVRFVFNSAQIILDNAINEQLEKLGMVRLLVLKGRQQGISTYVEGRYYWRTSWTRGVRCYILTHEREATKNLFDMAKLYHEKVPYYLRPATKHSNDKELVFNKLRSGYRVGTAGSKDTGRSQTNQYFHGSEVAFWPFSGAHEAGVIETVPDEPGTEIIFESTANGHDPLFYQKWQDAAHPDNDYLRVFIPWFVQAEYRRKVPDGFRIIGPGDTRIEQFGNEVEIARQFNLDNEQLSWRRGKIISKSNGLQKFYQEYPCTPEEAFSESIVSVFDRLGLEKAGEGVWKPRQTSTIRPGGRIIEHPRGEFKIWLKFDPREKYVIGADVAEGVVNGDYSCADVLRVSDGQQVAQWHGKVPPDMYGDFILPAIGKMYGKALIGVERNNHGLTTLIKLRDSGYPNIYAQKDIEYKGGGKETKKIGWLTTKASKPKIIDQLDAEIRDGIHGLACKETVEEMKHYVFDEDGSMGAEPGYFDDRVMSRAIAGEMRMLDEFKKHRRRKTVKRGSLNG